MKRDLQNYYRGLRERIKDADAKLFIAQMERKKEANSAFYYDFVVDDQGIFEKMPFTSVNHHLQSVFFRGAFLVNEKIESYEWLFQTFLLAMGGKAPRLVIRDEYASMKVAIRTVFPDSVHRFCMWPLWRRCLRRLAHQQIRINSFRMLFISVCRVQKREKNLKYGEMLS
jgi:zinc finger SWIM domain-containing protein 3